MRYRSAVVVFLLIGAASLLYAHDLFIKLDSYFLSPNTAARIPVLNGTFSVSENFITPDRVTDISLVSPVGRQQIDVAAWSEQGDTTLIALETGEPGTYVVGASTRTRDFELTAEQFNEYLEHDGIPDVLEARTRDNELDKGVTERYSKHVKAVFQVGNALTKEKRWWSFWRSEPGYLVPLGYPAEIVPLENPYALEVGSELRLRCLVDGEIVANQLVIAGGENEAGVIEERSARTDEYGLVGFTLDTPGKWYVKFINMVPSPDADIDYESKWATLTFEIR